jgi:hypothetical protein
MSEILTTAEIQRRFRSEWILLEDPQVSKDLRVLRGRVVFHSPDRDEVDRKAIQLRLRHSAWLFTGMIDAETAIVL